MISGSTAALRSFGDALGEDRGQQDLLGRADARVGQVELGAVQAVRRGDVEAVRGLLDHGTELAQRAEVEVDRPVADVAAAEVRDERVPDAVQQRSAEQDRDPAGTRVHVDLVNVGALHVGRIEDQLRWVPRLRRPVHRAVPTVPARSPRRGCGARRTGGSGFPEQGRHHGFGDEVLGAACAYLAPQRGVAMDDEDVVKHVVGQRNLRA